MAYQWVRENPKNLVHNGEFYYIGNGFDITEPDISKYLKFESNLNWASFDDFKKEMKRVYRVYMPSNWKDGECTFHIF